jgi:hypothetical protein
VAAGAALVLALGLSLLVGRRAGEPARRLTEAVDAASGEGFARRLEPGRYRVLAPLAASLDRLFRRLGEERALTAAAAASRRRAESPVAAEEEEALDLALVAVDLRRFARLADPREAGARLERDRARIAAAVEARGGRLVAAAGHRVLAAFDGDGAAWRAVTAGAAAVVAAGERESAFDEGEAPAAAVARGKGAVAAGTLVGPVVQLAESLLREAAPGDLTLARGVHGEVAGALSEQGLEASSQRGVLSPQPVFVLRGDALAAMAGGGATAGRGAAGTRPVPGSLFADRFEVLAREGSHGGVELLRAQDRELGLEVGLKWLPAGEGSSGGDALLESVRRLGHPHLARTFDVGASDGGRYLVREWVEGVAASRLGELPRPAALAFGRQLAGALAAVHREGLFHGRIKPENVFLEADGRVRVTDLGAGMVAGTAPSATAGDHLLAPEQEAGARGDARSDVYAMGALLHRLALAAWPGEPVAEEEGTAELAGVLARATAADPAARWADGGELLRALEGVTA